MNINKILSKVDHTLLSQSATTSEIYALCDDAIEYKTASVCIPPCFVKAAKEYVNGKIAICTVIGFPNGYNSGDVKAFETAKAVEDGADEIDMVINIGLVKEKKYDKVLSEINAVCAAAGGKLVKVIIETCLLTQEEKIEMCRVVSKSSADYIKTSTGFGGAGATKEDIILFKKHCAPDLKIKAAGGISSLEDAEDFLSLGADRLGTSRIIKLVKQN